MLLFSVNSFFAWELHTLGLLPLFLWLIIIHKDFICAKLIRQTVTRQLPQMEWKLICKLSSISWKSNYFLPRFIFVRPFALAPFRGGSLECLYLIMSFSLCSVHRQMRLLRWPHPRRKNERTRYGKNIKNYVRLIVLHKPLKFIKSSRVHLHSLWNAALHPHGIHLLCVQLLAQAISSTLTSARVKPNF